MRLDHCNFRLDSPVVSPHIRRLFFFNRYERPERRALERFLDPKLPVVELGSAVGVIACLANKKLHDPYRHVAVEANPDLLPLLRENRRLNDCHFTIMHRALAYGSREKTFYRASNYLGSNALKPCGIPIQVQTVILKQILETFGFEICTLICDIEGGESDLIAHELDVIRERVKTLILEVHDWLLAPKVVRTLLLDLEESGFVPVHKEEYNYVFINMNMIEQRMKLIKP